MAILERPTLRVIKADESAKAVFETTETAKIDEAMARGMLEGVTGKPIRDKVRLFIEKTCGVPRSIVRASQPSLCEGCPDKSDCDKEQAEILSKSSTRVSTPYPSSPARPPMHTPLLGTGSGGELSCRIWTASKTKP